MAQLHKRDLHKTLILGMENIYSQIQQGTNICHSINRHVVTNYFAENTVVEPSKTMQMVKGKQSLKYQLAIGHFLTNFPHLADQIQFARPNLLYISNGETNDSLLQCSCF